MAGLDVHDQIDQFLRGVGLEFAALPVFVQFGICQQLVGIDFDLVRAETVPQAGEVGPVRVGGRAEQVRHPVQNDLEPGCAQQGGGAACSLHVVPAFVDFQNVVIQALRAHLHLGHAQVAQPADLVWRDLVGAGFDHQPHVAVGGGFVERSGLRPVRRESISHLHFRISLVPGKGAKG